MSDSEMIETKPVLGQAHCASCWGYWDAKAKECGICILEEKCSVATRNIQQKASTSVVSKSIPVPVPVPAPAPAPAPEPKSAPVSSPVIKPKSFDAACSQKAENPASLPVSPEPPRKTDAISVDETVITQDVGSVKSEYDVIVDAILPSIPTGTVQRKDNERGFVLAFNGKETGCVLQVAFVSATGRLCMQNRKQERRVLDITFSLEEMKAALADLL